MHFKLVTISALIAVAVAQDFSQVPKCAMAPALQAFGKTGCALTDFKCLCTSTSLVPALEAAISAVCTPAEVAQVNAFAVSTCKSVGITLVIPSASGVTTTASSTTSSAVTSSSISSSSTSHATATTTTTSTVSSASMSSISSMSSMSSTSAMAGGSTTTTTTGSTMTSSTTSASSSSATGAGNALQVGAPALAGAVLFALAF